ncbi:isochorismate synthase [Natrialbaceae archaeon AArc-T1-2]|uniref:isochorismate synthase n=1 Tax=Natrialbaceae archaeon AArc-T1-2 TaxID=3053904 RepID=UPI00255B0EEB|nr:isochorismate synthase [Natrialbaceae archaeon AArc-T1-2]WIV67866.1 isochorismate synthase [Natrialbaceae archaeon AArc-T1-2]
MDRASGDGRLAGGPELDGSLVSRSCELEDVSFGAVLEVDGHPRVQWATPHGLEAAGCGVAMRFETSGPDRFETVRSAAADRLTALEHDGAPASRPRAFGGLSFHDSYDHDHDHDPAEPWQGFAGASFVVPRVQVTRTDDGTWLTVVAESDAAAADALETWRTRFATLPSMRPSGSAPGIDATRRTTDREAWTDGVETALGRIEAGDLEKVVLALSLIADLETPIDVAATLERLRRRYPDCYRFMIDRGDDGIFFGAPPERLVAVHGDHVETEALAGSVPRGETPVEDDTLVDRLCDSEKFQHEHRLVAETIRDQLEPLSSEVSVGERTVRRLATIQHLQTPIEATLSTDRHVLELVEALHPTPAVGGIPLSAAFETIREVECFDRGWYAAPVGWFDADGNGEFAVGIRSGVATDDAVTLFAGNGIVADSDPGEEWEEVQLKFRPILDELR